MLGTTQEWGQDEVRVLTVRNGIPTWCIVGKQKELQEEFNIIQSYKGGSNERF